MELFSQLPTLSAQLPPGRAERASNNVNATWTSVGERRRDQLQRTREGMIRRSVRGPPSSSVVAGGLKIDSFKRLPRWRRRHRDPI